MLRSLHAARLSGPAGRGGIRRSRSAAARVHARHVRFLAAGCQTRVEADASSITSSSCWCGCTLYPLPISTSRCQRQGPAPPQAALDELAHLEGSCTWRAAAHPDPLLCFTLEWLERQRTAEPRVRAGAGRHGPEPVSFRRTRRNRRTRLGARACRRSHGGSWLDRGAHVLREFRLAAGICCNAMPRCRPRPRLQPHRLLPRDGAREMRDRHGPRTGSPRRRRRHRLASSAGTPSRVTRSPGAWPRARPVRAPHEQQPVIVPSLDAVPAADCRRHCASSRPASRHPYDALRIRGLADSVAWSRAPAIACGRVATAGPRDGTRHCRRRRRRRARAIPRLASRLDSTLLAEAFGERGRIRLEALQ